MRRIQHAAVLGAGTMGAQIAAHLANGGLPVLLLDLTKELADHGLARARQLKPDPFFLADSADLIRTGGYDALPELHACDWIVEAIVEDLQAKQQLLARVDECRVDDSVISSNTSGIPLAALANGRSASFRRHWIGSHFFNPPRFLRLVELIPTSETDPEVAGTLADFLDLRLGKGVVVAKDTPAFIANRIGLFGVVRIIEALASGTYTVEEIDAITGPAIGRPKSATCRTLDLAGLDVLALVARDLTRRLPPEEARMFVLPPLIEQMVQRGWLGEKSGQGLYKRIKSNGETAILSLDVDAFSSGDPNPYRPYRAPDLPALESARPAGALPERVRMLFRDAGRAGSLLREAVMPAFEYADRIAPDIAHSIDDVDRAMRWGYGWELGPLEMLDALGAGHRRREGLLPPARPDLLVLQSAKRRGRAIKTNPSADLVDLDDGVLCVEFHSKMNTIDEETIAMIEAGVAEATANALALVVGNEGENFSAGANLVPLLAAAQTQRWNEIDRMIRTFQRATMALKTAPIPVIAAPAGLTLGGGCEICLHAARVHAAAETYMGLVELGVGLIPAGGGSKETLLGAGADARAVQQRFETIALAKVSTSGPHARRLGYLRESDAITMNRERLIAEAKATALLRAKTGYVPARPRTDVVVGGAETFALLSLGVHLARRAGRISDHDAVVARKLAWVLSGGDLPHKSVVTEEHLLDLEREAFLSLCGEASTQERIGYTLRTGKALRN